MSAVRFRPISGRVKWFTSFDTFSLTTGKPDAYLAFMGTVSKEKILLNISDFAERLGVTRQTVHNWLLAGTCPVAPIVGTKPRKWLATRVDAFLADRGE